MDWINVFEHATGFALGVLLVIGAPFVLLVIGVFIKYLFEALLETVLGRVFFVVVMLAVCITVFGHVWSIL